jgi:hypothetical protein
MTTGAEGERIAAAAAVGLHLEVAGSAAESAAAAIAVGLHLEGMEAVAAAVAVGLALGGGLSPHVPAVDWWKTAGRLDAQGGRAAAQYGRRARARTITR